MMDGKQAREWRLYVDDMKRFAQNVQAYTEGMEKADLLGSGITYDATLRNLELIGEAAAHIPERVRAANPQVPWRLIVATRNRLIHAYLGIDDDTVWSIVQDDIPSLLSALDQLSDLP
jgi:uncharacterized protein with HEPN domain